MKPKKTSSLTNRAKSKDKTLGTAATYREANSRTGFPESWIRKACDAGGCRTPGGRIDLTKAKQWIESNAKELESTSDTLPLKEQKLAEEVRKLRLKNDQTQGKLVELAWINERFQRFGGEIHAIRARSESEHPVKFGEAAGDVAACRTVLRGIWDEILREMRDASKHFA